MISFQRSRGGRPFIVLNRCNDWGDHKSPELNGADGDICLPMDQEASLDVRHAEVLVERIRQRLGHAPGTKLNAALGRVEVRYAIGDVVYHRVVEERARGLVTGLLIRPGLVFYAVTWPDRVERYHLGEELTDEYVPNYPT